MKRLKDLTKDEYETLKAMGFLWEFYLEATGDWEVDCNKKDKHETSKE